MNTIDVKPIMEEIQRLAEERRRLRSTGHAPSQNGSGANVPLPISASQADLLNLPVAPSGGLRGQLKGFLHRLRQKALSRVLRHQTAFNRAAVESLETLGTRLQEALQSRAEFDQRTEQALDTLGLQIQALPGSVEQMELAWLRAPATVEEEHEALKARLDELRMDLLRLWSQREALSRQLRTETDTHLAGLRFQVAELGRRWRRLFWEADQKIIPPSLAHAAREYYQEFDYFGFEERLRGNETSIRDKQQLYLRYFHGSVASSSAPILDVGCGRGEFLELLRGAGLSARGVDISLDNILRCQEKGLEVVHADALEYLASLPHESLGGIFACQFVEHLPVSHLVAFARTCFQKLQPGGKVILETINPECVVAMKNFYADLSHHKPIPAATAHFLLESSGFQQVETLYLAPYPAEDALGLCAGTTPLVPQINRAFERLNRLLFGYQDYAVVATR